MVQSVRRINFSVSTEIGWEIKGGKRRQEVGKSRYADHDRVLELCNAMCTASTDVMGTAKGGRASRGQRWNRPRGVAFAFRNGTDRAALPSKSAIRKPNMGPNSKIGARSFAARGSSLLRLASR